MFNYQQGGVATLEPQTVGLNGQTRIPEFGGIPTGQTYFGGVPTTGIPMSQTTCAPFGTVTPTIPAYPTVQPGIHTVAPVGFGGVPVTPFVAPTFNPMTAATTIPYGGVSPSFAPAFNPMLPWLNQAPVQPQLFSNTVPFGGINGFPVAPSAQVNPMINPLQVAVPTPTLGTGGLNVPFATAVSPMGIPTGFNPNTFGPFVQPYRTQITPFGAVQVPFLNTPIGSVTNPLVHPLSRSVFPNTIPGLVNNALPWASSHGIPNYNNYACNTPLGTGTWGPSLFGVQNPLQVPGSIGSIPFQGNLGWSGIPGVMSGNPFVNPSVAGPLGVLNPMNPQLCQPQFGPFGSWQSNPWACNPIACNIPGYAGQAFGGVGGLIPNPYTVPTSTPFGAPMNTASLCPIC